MKKILLFTLILIGCHKPTQFVVSPQTPQIIEFAWDITGGSKRPDYYYFQKDRNPPIQLSQIAYCKENYGNTCKYRTSVTDVLIHDYTFWPATPSEEGPKATIRYSVAGEGIAQTPPSEPSKLRIVPVN